MSAFCKMLKQPLLLNSRKQVKIYINKKTLAKSFRKYMLLSQKSEDVTNRVKEDSDRGDNRA